MISYLQGLVIAVIDFAEYMRKYLVEYLPTQRGASIRTIQSYRDTFKLFLKYFDEVLNVQPHNIKLKICTAETIMNFLLWLEDERHSSISTRNQRLAALRSFFKYVQFEVPESITEFQRIASIPAKKQIQPTIPYLSADGMKALLSIPDKRTEKGRRDLTLLSLLYDSGCRVQELIMLKVSDIILHPQGIVTLHGKGGKLRRTPLMSNMVELLDQYLSEHNLAAKAKSDNNIFLSNRNAPLTKEGVSYIISKYVQRAQLIEPSIPDKVTPHMFRHSKAMHMLQAGISLIYIRDFLGHSDLKTTEIYAKADTEIKRRAIEKNTVNLLPDYDYPTDWHTDKNLLDWLSSL